MGTVLKIFTCICVVAVFSFVFLSPHVPEVQVLPHTGYIKDAAVASAFAPPPHPDESRQLQASVIVDAEPAQEVAHAGAAEVTTEPSTTKKQQSPPKPILEEEVGCMAFRDKRKCIRHVDGRSMELFGNARIRGEPCVWCCGKPCTPGGNVCEPKDFLEKGEEWFGEGQTATEDTCSEEEVEFHQDPQEYDGEKLTASPFPSPMEMDERKQLSVPKFWEPPAGMDIDSHVHHLNGHPSIFLMIASYRDFQCPETITSALERAVHPGRIVVGVVSQNAPEDPPCDVPAKPCAEDPTQAMCRHKSRINVFNMPLDKAEGPIYARHVGHRMYRGEAFILQVDAHVTFVNGWDVSLIKQWNATKNEYAVISTYLTDVQGSIDSKGRSTRVTRPIMCVSGFSGSNPSIMLQGAQPEEVPKIRSEPMLHAWWAAGMSFSRGHFVVRVPYDCCAPGVFMGEEISMGVRAWTHGYDLYAPQASVFFHEYAANSPRRASKHFLHGGGHTSHVVTQRSLGRLMALIKLDPQVTDYDDSQATRYGIGTARPVELFYKIFLIDTARKKHIPICLFAATGVQHRAFKPHLRPDGKGIDFTGALADFDTVAAVEQEMKRPGRMPNPGWDNAFRKALTTYFSSRHHNM